MKKLFTNIKSTALAELLLAISMFALVGGSVSIFSIDAVRNIQVASQKNQAVEQIKEIINAININKQDSWNAIKSATIGSQYKITYNPATDKYDITLGNNLTNGLTSSFVVTNVNRDVSGNIVTAPSGILDPHTKKIDMSITWSDILGKNRNVTETYYLNDWNTLQWLETTQAELNDGTKTFTEVTSVSGGEVTLERIFFPDWCRPTTALNTYNIPGNATAKTVFGLPNRAYLGTGGNATGDSFTNLSITSVINPIMTVDGIFNGYLTNNIFVTADKHYAFLATSHATKKVVIIDLTTNPYSEVGYYSPTPATADIARSVSVSVSGTVGYVAIGQYVHTFNLTAYTGARAKYSSIKVIQDANSGHELTANVSKFVVRGNYLYASLDEDWYELVIIRVTNPSSLARVAQKSVNNSQTFDIYVSPDGKYTYFGTGYLSTEAQFWVMDTTTKTTSGVRVIGSFKTNKLNVRAIAVIEADNRAVLVGDGINSPEEYVAVTLSADKKTITRCGGMALEAGINDIDSVSDSEGNAFSYFVTNDGANDFQINRGGPGNGGGADGYGYQATGTYVSSALDSGVATPSYYSVEGLAIIPVNDTATIQLRTDDNVGMTSPTAWVDVAGTGGSSPMNTVNSITWNSSFNQRYLQYRINFTSDTFSTPVVNSVKILYQ